ncbi:hypothetical protein [Sphingomonas yantingensis]|uniref:Uncharacterized protein n=1 Tax=Sphingomonas yantingensis TaxID=1241761 RepID=A0A7W9EI16_9SPHN|nr:hypothetical protein [Sphingomonas yantingensis]MBB5698712.1 hypothetical protein [Sphingomonas yantingensis]
MKWSVVRAWGAKIALSVALMVFGADLWSLYLCSIEPTLAASIDRLNDWFGPTLIVLMALYHWLSPARENEAYKDVSPRLSGAVTVMLVGTAAAIALVSYSAALAAGTWLLAILVTIVIWRFASKNADQIGEARFGVTGD